MKLAICLLTLLIAVFSGFAQTTSTSILGTVTDSSGAIVAGARLTVRDVDTGIQREEVTSNTGDYNFPLLNVGNYEVTVPKKASRRNPGGGSSSS
jgi:Carboxypeptidase regulatory-like domain